MGQRENFLQAARELMNDPLSQPAGGESDGPVSPDFFARQNAPGTTVIARGAVIHGSLRAAGGVEFYGEMYGDITSGETLTLSGHLEGNAVGLDVELSGARVKGNLAAANRVRVDGGTVVLGDIQAGALHLNGSVKGDLTVRESAILEEKAAVAGNITAGRLSIAEGAILQGQMRVSSADLGKRFTEEPDTNP